jgi:hypothetical protein
VQDAPEVLQDLLIFDVWGDNAVVHVDIYGGFDNVCGSIHFRFENRRERSRHLATLRVWEERGIPLTLVVRGSRVALVNDYARGQA